MLSCKWYLTTTKFLPTIETICICWERVTFARASLLHGDSFARASLKHEVTRLHGGSLLHEGKFCTETLLHAGSFLHGDIFTRQNFCTTLHLHGEILQSVTFARRYIFTEIFMHCENFKQLVNFERRFTFARF